MVKGTITDEHGDPLAGVSVIVKNTTRGVASDLDGNYSIQASSSETLEFSFLSMFTEERKNGKEKNIDRSSACCRDVVSCIVCAVYCTGKGV